MSFWSNKYFLPLRFFAIAIRNSNKPFDGKYSFLLALQASSSTMSDGIGNGDCPKPNL